MATWTSPIIQTISREGHFGHMDHATDSSKAGRPGSNPKQFLTLPRPNPSRVHIQGSRNSWDNISKCRSSRGTAITCTWSLPQLLCDSAFVWHLHKGTSLLRQGPQNTSVTLAGHFINQNRVWIISSIRETVGARNERENAFLHGEKCLAEQQKRKHLKSERKLSAGRIKWSKSADTSSAWPEQQHTALLAEAGRAVDQDTESLDSPSSTTADLSCGKARKVPSSPLVPQLPHL